MAPSTREREDARPRRGVVALAVVAALVLVGAVVFTATRDADEAAPGASASSPQNPCPSPTSQAVPEAPRLQGPPDPASVQGQTVTAVLTTSCGDITLRLDAAAAPQAVANFVYLAQEDFYSGTPCHRLTTEGIYVLQCGDPTGTGTGGPGYSWGPIENAPGDDVYPAGTLAMARQGGDASSMGSQFFLVYEDSTIPSDAAGGYTVFGEVTSGLDIVQQIAAGGTAQDGVAPAFPISIEGVSIQ